jgi:hypothetical protein
MGRTLFKQALCQLKVDGCLSGLSPFLGFFIFFFAFFLKTFFSDLFFFWGGMLIGFCWDWIVFLGFGVGQFFIFFGF